MGPGRAGLHGRRRRLSAVAAAGLACLLAPAPAWAGREQASLIQDDAQLLERGPDARDRALDDVVALGADGVRVVVAWEDLAPAASARRPPRGFDAGDPAAYPAARWAPLDGVVRGAQVRGLSVLLSASTPAPVWASACRPQRRLCRPKPAAYGAWLRALGRRYSGAWRDEDGAPLPRVTRWAFLNEPNQPGWLRPQYARRQGRAVPVAAVAYRGLVRAGLDALRATGHGADERLLGDTAPIGRRTGALATRPVAPAPFLRTLLCLDRRDRPLRGAAARAARCAGRVRRLEVTGYAHHPYTRGGSRPPSVRGAPGLEITVASAGRLERLLDAGAGHRRLPARLPLHYTEFGFQSDPPDRLFGVPLAAQAAYLNQADWIAYRDPRVRSVAQYLLRDDAVVSSFQSGLRFADGRPKPAWDAYRLPLWVSRQGERRLRIYGQVRPAAPRAAGPVAIENAALGAGPFRTVRVLGVRTGTGAFAVSVPRREGRWRLRWTAPDGTERVSREAVPG